MRSKAQSKNNAGAKRKRKPGMGKAKGAAFERQVCEALSKWVTEGERKDVFWRSAMSGGRASLALKRGDTMAHVSGDICAVHEAGHKFIDTFFVECKFYKDLGLANLVLSNGGKLEEFWIKCKTDARMNGKLPMLIAKQNGKATLAVLDFEGIKMLRVTHEHPNVIDPALDMNVFRFSHLLECADASRFDTNVRPTPNVKPKRRVSL